MHSSRWLGICLSVAMVSSIGVAAAADTLSLDEAKLAAGARFDKLEKDHDGTLDAKEVKGRIGAKTFKAADPDNDGTLSKDEFLSLVEKFFKQADSDSDGTLSVVELHSKAGVVLKQLIQ